jgi:predicted nucleic acid-binding protein
MYLLDTNVVSELRKAAKANKNVRAWAESLQPSTLFLSVVTVLELETGILLIERRDTTQGKLLRSWMNDYVMPAFAGRILSVDVAVAQHCARLQVPNPRSNRDALIAATALVHGLTVATRNVPDFEPTGVAIHNPWQ